MGVDQPTELSKVFDELRRNVEGAEERLFALVYGELHRMAHHQMAREGPGHTLQTTALVHEAYLKLLGGDQAGWENRRHFFGAAAIAMRRILVDRARRKKAKVHGGDVVHVPLDGSLPDAQRPVDIIALDRALDRLAGTRPRHAAVVGYRYFLGLTVKESADLLGVSPRTVDSDWEFAKSWLRREIARGDAAAPGS